MTTRTRWQGWTLSLLVVFMIAGCHYASEAPLTDAEEGYAAKAGASGDAVVAISEIQRDADCSKPDMDSIMGSLRRPRPISGWGKEEETWIG